MTCSIKQELLRNLPSINDLLASEEVDGWLEEYPRKLVTQCLRDVVDSVRQQILADEAGRCGTMHVSHDFIVTHARVLLDQRSTPHIHKAINATGIILHTALGRAVWPESVVESMVEDLKGYVTLAIDCDSGIRSDRDQRVEYILQELTGAEAATVVNNNAAATMLVLAALAADNEVIVSRGQLIEIGGAFRLPDVMSMSGAKLVEVGTTNRTHLRDYANAIGEETAAVMRVHPSNFRVVGFTGEVALDDLVELGRSRDVLVIDDLGAGALVNLEDFGLPYEPTVSSSIEAGADVVLFSADKLIGASQGGIIVGKKELIDRIRKHPLARAMRVDKTCLMALERTLHMFRDPEKLRKQHPTYRMLNSTTEELHQRAKRLADEIASATNDVSITIQQGVGYLGSGSLPMHELSTWCVGISCSQAKSSALARSLRLDKACIFTRLEDETVMLDVRTINENEISAIAQAVARVVR